MRRTSLGREGWWVACKLVLGRFLNRLGANLALCATCRKYTTWDERRLIGPFMLCRKCDEQMTKDLKNDG